MIPGSANPLLLAAAEETGAYQISRSVRFNSSDSAYLSRTPASAGNRKTWTYSTWIKRSNLTASDYVHIFGIVTSGASLFSVFVFKTGADSLQFFAKQALTQPTLETANLLRDPSAWYHIVLSIDTTQAAASDRAKIYINGVEASYAVDNRSSVAQNTDLNINNTLVHEIGGNPSYTNTRYLNGYLADIHFIDGQALDPTSFGEYDDNNVWQPKKYTFTTNPNNGTTWSSTTNGNFWSAIGRGADKAFNGNFNGTDYAQATTGNTATVSGLGITGINKIRVNIAKNSGGDNWGTFALDSTDLTSWLQSNYPSVSNSGTWIDVTSQFTSSTLGSISITTNNASTDVRLAAVEINDFVLLDGADDNSFKLDFSDNSSNAALGNDSSGNNNDWTVNNLFAYAPGLSTANQGMDVVTYTGNGSTQSITGLSFQPDFVWFKARSGTAGVGNHRVFDVVRGVHKQLLPNLNNAEGTDVNTLTAFNSNGFSLGSSDGVNGSGTNYVAWCWKAGGTAVSNTDGSVTSSVSANQTYGFSVVKYALSGSSAETIGHGLNGSLGLLITKATGNTNGWAIWHSSFSDTQGIAFTTGAVGTQTWWDQSNMTSSVFAHTSGTTSPQGGDVIAYCWSEVPGFSKFSDYNGNGSTQTITTGFKPAWIMIKRYDSSASGADWYILDTKRISGTQEYLLSANSNNNETSTLADYVVLNPDGFLLNTGTTLNGSGRSYIYAAFASKPDESVIDSLIDTPTNYEAASGNNGGNYATLNPLNLHQPANDTLSNGNLECSMASGSAGLIPSTIGFSSGKFYYEVIFSGSVQFLAGIRRSDSRNYDNTYTYHATGNKYTNGGSATSYGATFTDGDVIGVAVDMDAGTLTFYKNGASQGQAFSGISGTYTFIQGKYSGSGGSYIVNFGQRPFAYTAPSGFQAINTASLSDPTIADGSTAMDVALYTGNGSTQTISGLNFSPDLAWIKRRDSAGNHALFDQVRGAGKFLILSSTSAEGTDANSLTGFTSDGFSVGQSTTAPTVNGTSQTYVGWAWDGGTSTVSNTDGSITSQVRANQTAGFSIVKYTNVGSTNSTIGHGLGVAPKLLIVRYINNTSGWFVYHADTGAGNYLQLQSTGASTSLSSLWNNTAPTSTVFSVGTAWTSSVDTIAYCFAPVDGYSSFGSYTGNGSTDGPFVYTGFRPRWVLIKRTGAAASWVLHDTERSTYNVSGAELLPNDSGAEYTYTRLDFLSNGFKARTTEAASNTSGNTYVYAAFAEHPFKTARAR